MATDPKNQKIVKDSDLHNAAGGFLKNEIPVDLGQQAQLEARNLGMAQSERALGGVSAGSMSKVKVAGWTNKQAIDGVAVAQQQNDQSLSAASGGLSKVNVAGWTNKQNVQGVAGTQDNSDGKVGSNGLP